MSVIPENKLSVRYLWQWLIPPLMIVQYVRYFSLWITSCFHIMWPVGQNQVRCYVSSHWPGGGKSRMSHNVWWSEVVVCSYRRV